MIGIDDAVSIPICAVTGKYLGVSVFHLPDYFVLRIRRIEDAVLQPDAGEHAALKVRGDESCGYGADQQRADQHSTENDSFHGFISLLPYPVNPE